MTDSRLEFLRTTEAVKVMSEFWDGVARRDSYKGEIVELRDRLADAARAGNWPEVFSLLESEPEWINCGRVGGRSGFAPLHQAAWQGVDEGIVSRLIARGAWRTLRDSAGLRAYDIAERRGHRHLAEVLRPVVVHTVPEETLSGLERNFHALILERVAAFVAEPPPLRLPQLEPMTEVSDPDFWFPVPGMYGGFSYRLAGNELEVDSWCRIVGYSGRTHRVTTSGVRLIMIEGYEERRLPSMRERPTLGPDHAGRVRGTLLGGALGDALGYEVEFSDLAGIRGRFGPGGIVGLDQSSGQVSDDTQMTLFVAEGLIEAITRNTDLATGVFQASLRWLDTQTLPGPAEGARGLAAQEWLYARRAPGNACMSGLATGRMGTPEARANPDSKGCGAVMRSAPFGLIPAHDARTAFANAATCAVQTHGHPSGYLAAGALAALIRLLYEGARIMDALHQVFELLREHPGHQEVTAALEQAIRAAESEVTPSAEVVEQLGQGWVAEEALAIGLYCALVRESSQDGEPSWAIRDALKLAVNHGGDSDSTGSICGNIMGVIFGQRALPKPHFLEGLEGREEITALADEFAVATAPGR